MEFTKMHGLGNDYIYFNCTKQPVQNPEKLSVLLSDRHKGVGGDGIVLILNSEVADFKMRMFNADGSEGKMCGNATRCIGKYVYERGLTAKTDLTLETLSGIKKLHLCVQNGKVQSVTVDMGQAVLTPRDIPVRSEGESFIHQKITAAGQNWYASCVSMGNPHAVIFCEDVLNLPLEKIGPEFENHPLFPERINTEFVKQLNKTTLQMRVFERGSGETMACGTGACAVVVAAVLNGLCQKDEEITVQLLGGDLKIKWSSNGTVYMTGTADFVFDGTLLMEV